VKPRDNLSPILLPGLRAHMGNWVYYICFLKMRDIAERISIAKEIHSSEALRELLQRQLRGERAKEIKEYLLKQEERFFNALVVGSYGGNPEWYELSIDPEDQSESFPEYIEGSLGILKLNGSERLFAIDGQHRIAGIREAIAERPDLGNEEVCVIFVAGVVQERDLNGLADYLRL
jgi:DNA sulfur modification protein DndB